MLSVEGLIIFAWLKWKLPGKHSPASEKSREY
jgi:hypothetical protein